MTDVAGCFGKLFSWRQKWASVAATQTTSGLSSAGSLSKADFPVLLTREHYAAEPCCYSFDEIPRAPKHERDELNNAPPAYSAGLLPKEVGTVCDIRIVQD